MSTDGMLVIHLPDGPTAHFRLSNVKLTPELKVCRLSCRYTLFCVFLDCQTLPEN
jgi:rRNA maturation protein Rpf1